MQVHDLGYANTPAGSSSAHISINSKLPTFGQSQCVHAAKNKSFVTYSSELDVISYSRTADLPPYITLLQKYHLEGVS